MELQTWRVIFCSKNPVLRNISDNFNVPFAEKTNEWWVQGVGKWEEKVALRKSGSTRHLWVLRASDWNRTEKQLSHWEPFSNMLERKGERREDRKKVLQVSCGLCVFIIWLVLCWIILLMAWCHIINAKYSNYKVIIIKPNS